MPLMKRHGTSASRRTRRLLVSGMALVALVGTTVLGASSAMGDSTTSSAIKVGEYPLPGGDLQNTRNVPGPINSSNVATLKKVWSLPIRGSGSFGTYATTPIVVGGVVYTQDIDSNVYAINLKSGKLQWYKKYNSPSVGPNGVTVSTASSTARRPTRRSRCRRAPVSSSGRRS